MFDILISTAPQSLLHDFILTLYIYICMQSVIKLLPESCSNKKVTVLKCIQIFAIVLSGTYSKCNQGGTAIYKNANSAVYKTVFLNRLVQIFLSLMDTVNRCILTKASTSSFWVFPYPTSNIFGNNILFFKKYLAELFPHFSKFHIRLLYSRKSSPDFKIFFNYVHIIIYDNFRNI